MGWRLCEASVCVYFSDKTCTRLEHSEDWLAFTTMPLTSPSSDCHKTSILGGFPDRCLSWGCYTEIFWVIVLVQTMSALLWPACLWWQCLWPSLSFLWPKSSWASFWHYILMHIQQIRWSPKTPSAASSGLSSCYSVDTCVWGHTHWFLHFFLTIRIG